MKLIFFYFFIVIYSCDPGYYYIELPKKSLKSVKIPSNMTFLNLKDVTIDKLTIGKITYTNWNKETEADIRKTTTIHMVCCDDADFSRFVNLKDMKIEGVGKIKLPPHVENVLIDDGITIENQNEVKIDKLKKRITMVNYDDSEEEEEEEE